MERVEQTLQYVLEKHPDVWDKLQSEFAPFLGACIELLAESTKRTEFDVWHDLVMADLITFSEKEEENELAREIFSIVNKILPENLRYLNFKAVAYFGARKVKGKDKNR